MLGDPPELGIFAWVFKERKLLLAAHLGLVLVGSFGSVNTYRYFYIAARGAPNEIVDVASSSPDHFNSMTAALFMIATTLVLLTNGAHGERSITPPAPTSHTPKTPARATAPTSLIDRLKTANFTCTPKAVGQICVAAANRATGFAYPQPIAVLIPAGVNQPKQILLNLHGFRGTCPATNATPEQIEADWQLTQQMISGGAGDSVMLFPMSRGNCATYDASLVSRFKSFTDWAAKLIQPATPRWFVAGHSGAGARLAKALSTTPTLVKNTDAVFLLDATYGMGSADSPLLDQWAEVVRQNAQIKIFTRFIAGTSPATGSKNLQLRLPNHVDSAVSAAKSHCRVPAVEIKNLLQQHLRTSSKELLRTVSF